MIISAGRGEARGSSGCEYNASIAASGTASATGRLADLILPPGRRHRPRHPVAARPHLARPAGPSGWRAARTPLFNAFQPLGIDVEHLVAESDLVAVRFRLTATHAGPLMGIPATGRTITMTGTDINRFEAGQIAERWGNEDRLGLLQQLGALPAPAAG